MEDIPNGITCKLTHRIMLDPVTTPFGQVLLHTHTRARAHTHIHHGLTRTELKLTDMPNNTH